MLAMLLIVLAFLAIVQQQRGPKMRPYPRAQQPEHTIPRLLEVHRMHFGYVRILGTQ